MVEYKDNPYYATRLLILLFILFTTISYGFTLYYRRFNGDFLGWEVTLSQEQLFFNYIISILPYIGLWRVYLYFKKRPINKRVTIPIRFFRWFLYFVFIASLMVTLLYGVGKMGNPDYQAPFAVKPFIIILNRFPLSYLGLLFILVSNKRRHIFIITTMMIILGIARAGLGIFLFLGIVFLLKSSNIILYIKKRFLLFVVIMIIFPMFVTYMYQVRSSMRVEGSTTTGEFILTGVLIGRLSSFSNAGFIMQYENSFRTQTSQLDPFYYQKFVMSAVGGESLTPKLRPEKMLPEAAGAYMQYGSYMCGTPGNLLFSYYKHPFIALLNFLTMMGIVMCTFKVSRRFKTKYANEIGILFMIYPVLSGVGNEYAFLLFVLFLFLVLILIMNSLSKYIYGKKS